jgi:hypothetical protein
MSQVGIVIVAGNREHREAVSEPALVAWFNLGVVLWRRAWAAGPVLAGTYIGWDGLS